MNKEHTVSCSLFTHKVKGNCKLIPTGGCGLDRPTLKAVLRHKCLDDHFYVTFSLPSGYRRHMLSHLRAAIVHRVIGHGRIALMLNVIGWENLGKVRVSLVNDDGHGDQEGNAIAFRLDVVDHCVVSQTTKVDIIHNLSLSFAFAFADIYTSTFGKFFAAHLDITLTASPPTPSAEDDGAAVALRRDSKLEGNAFQVLCEQFLNVKVSWADQADHADGVA